jgi:hypothetical protein
MAKRTWTLALTLTLTACGNSNTPTTPSTTPSTTTTFALSGQVYDVIVVIPFPFQRRWSVTEYLGQLSRSLMVRTGGNLRPRTAQETTA